MKVPPCEIPGFGKGSLPPSAHEAESFLEEVEDVTRLVDGLRSGKVSAEYVDRVLREKDEETQQKEMREKQAKEEAEKNKYDNLPEDKKTEVREKVVEMMREKERRERARELYAKYQEKLGSRPDAFAARRSTATDYTSWDLWTPSDDEEDPWMKYTPDNPAFKAMEKDIDARHERQVRRRQTAHRAREAGNAAFKAGQFAEALKTFEKGLESDKRSIELHGNAALAALKCGCFAQTIEHCDRACELAEFFLERPDHPTAVKCLLRRAAARDALAHFAEAVADLERAAELDPDDAEITKRLAVARRRREDARAERALKKRLRDAKASTNGGGEGEGVGDGSEEDAFARTVRLERLMRRVGGSGGTSRDDGIVDYDAVAALLAEHEACRVFARGGGGAGIGKLASRLANPPDARVGAGAAKALAAACVSEANCECLALAPDRVLAVVRFASRRSASFAEAAALDASFHAMEVLRECSRHEGPRRAVVAAFARLAAEQEATHEKDNPGAHVRAPRLNPFGALKDQLRIPAAGARDAADPRARDARLRNARCALAVFGNLALDPGARALVKGDCSSVVANATAERARDVESNVSKREVEETAEARDADAFPHVVGGWIGSPRGDDETTRLAAAAIGNGCADPAWRAACVSGVHGASLSRKLFEALPVRDVANAKTAPAGLGLGLGLGQREARSDGEGAEAARRESDAETAASVLAALSNVLLEPAARAWVCGHAARVVEKLLSWLLVTPPRVEDDSAEKTDGAAVAARAAATLSRCAREKEVVRALRSARGAGGAFAVARFVAQTARRTLSMEASHPSFAASASALDGGTRALASVASFADVEDSETDDVEATALGVVNAAGSSLAACVCSPKVADGVVGNAALALGDLARHDALLASLETLEPALVPSLLAACRHRKGAAQKNAAIACARLARHAPFMAALKEHHGIELIYSYVKP